jgi:hypothetical protein
MMSNSTLKHLEKYLAYLELTLYLINIPSTKDEGPYIYPLKVRGSLHIYPCMLSLSLIRRGVRTLPLICLVIYIYLSS